MTKKMRWVVVGRKVQQMQHTPTGHVHTGTTHWCSSPEEARRVAIALRIVDEVKHSMEVEERLLRGVK